MTTATMTRKAHHAAVEARRHADEAMARANEAQAVADAATAKARAEADARLARDAERTLSTWDEDHAASEKRVAAARDAFYQQAATADSLTTVRDRYLDWQSAASGHFFLYRALANALGRLGQTLFRGVTIPAASPYLEPPAFTKALDTAITRAITQRNADLEDAFHERIHAIENGVE